MGASVQIMPRRVAMFGWIIPAPLLMPARQYTRSGDDGRVNCWEMSFGKVSVVQIARAVFSQALCVVSRAEYPCGIPFRILSMGSLREALGILHT
jgi:hypothetical protein